MEHTCARLTTSVGLSSALGYLLWRALYSLDQTNLWLSVPALAVEIAGFAGSLALAWALWPAPASAAHADNSADSELQVGGDVDVVVRVHRQTAHDLRATLLSLRAVASVHDVIVVDVAGRPDVAAVAAEFGTACVAVECGDDSGLIAVVAEVRTPRFLLLDAGAVPTGDIVERLLPSFADQRVAVAQGLGVPVTSGSVANDRGRNERQFECWALNPSLGRRGCAFWIGSGSLVSVDALREVLTRERFGTALEHHWSLSRKMMSAGWRVVAPDEAAVIAQPPEACASAAHAHQRARARASRNLLSRQTGSLTLAQRLSVLAWCVQPLSGIRRAAFITLVAVAIYAGSVPFTASPLPMAIGWLPGLICTSVGIALLSGWKLRPGDRARWSLLSMGAACGSWREPTRESRPTSRPESTSDLGAGLLIAVTALCFVLLLRGISDRFTHTLGQIPRAEMLALLLVALWTLALSLDLLQLLARRAQMRRSVRVVSLFPATLGERSANIIDLNPRGAGLLSQTARTVGERAVLGSAIPTVSGVTSVQVDGVVRSVTRIDRNSWRVGVEFVEVDNDLANALAEFCTIEPMWRGLGVLSVEPSEESRRVELLAPREVESPASGSGLLRLLAIVAMISAVASSIPGALESGMGAGQTVAVVAFAGVIAAGLLLGLIGPSTETEIRSYQLPRSASAEPSSSFSPDLAIK